MKYPLEGRTQRFIVSLVRFCKALPYDVAVREIVRQVVRSGGSIGANYVEAVEALSKKDCLLHLRIARKEARETEFWLSVISELIASAEVEVLKDEARQLTRILTAIIKKSE